MPSTNITQMPLPENANLPVLRQAGTQLSTDISRRLLEDDLIDTGRLWRVISRYRKLIFAWVVIFGISAFIYSLLLRPMYTAISIARVNSNTSIVSVGNDVEGAIGGNGGVNWKATATSINILMGASIGKELVRDLDLAGDPEFTGALTQRRLIPRLGTLPAGVRNFFSSGVSQQAKPGKFDEQTLGKAASIYSSNVVVEEIDGTNLIQVSYKSFSPETAAKVVNNVVDTFNRVESEEQRATALSAQEILNFELENVQQKLQLSERKITEFSRKTGILDIEGSNNIVSGQVLSISEVLLATQRERRELEILITNAKNAEDRGVLPSLLKNERITQLQSELARLGSEYQQISAVFKEDFPKLKALESQMQRLEADIGTAADSAIATLLAEYKILVDKERALTQDLDTSNSEMLDLKDRSIAFNVLKREWESNKNLYEGLLEKVKRAGLAANLKTSSMTLLEAAPPPRSSSYPNIPKNVIVAMSVGGMFGLAGAFFMALGDRLLRSITDVEDYTQLPVLGVIPTIVALDGDVAVTRSHVAMITHTNPNDPAAESFRSFRTSLLYARPGEDLNIIMVTSSGPSEGKTSSIVNLATTYAKSEKRVLLIDFDLRKPALHTIMGVSRGPGVTDALVTGTANVRKTTIPNLYILTAGTNCPNPSEVLESFACRNLVSKVKDSFDIVLLDSPPIMGLADALIISQYVKTLTLAVDIEQTNKDVLKSAMNRLHRVNAPISGVLLTRYSADSTDDYGYHYSNYNNYTYGDDAVAGIEDEPEGKNWLQPAKRLIKKTTRAS